MERSGSFFHPNVPRGIQFMDRIGVFAAGFDPYVRSYLLASEKGDDLSRAYIFLRAGALRLCQEAGVRPDEPDFARFLQNYFETRSQDRPLEASGGLANFIKNFVQDLIDHPPKDFIEKAEKRMRKRARSTIGWN